MCAEQGDAAAAAQALARRRVGRRRRQAACSSPIRARRWPGIRPVRSSGSPGRRTTGRRARACCGGASAMRIDAELRGELVELRLRGEGHLRHAEAAEGAEAQLVGVGDAAVGAHVRDAVRAALHQQGVAEHAGAVVAVGAAVEQQLDLARDERAVAPGAGLDADRERMARPHRLEVFLAREDQAHRAPRLHRQQHDDRLDVRLHLVAEAGADARRQAAQPGHRQAERLADARLDAEHRLVRRPQRDPAAGLDLGERAARARARGAPAPASGRSTRRPRRIRPRRRRRRRS